MLDVCGECPKREENVRRGRKKKNKKKILMVIHIKTKRVGASLGTGERRVAKRKRTDLNSLSSLPSTGLPCVHIYGSV